MNPMTRRDLLKAAGCLVASHLPGEAQSTPDLSWVSTCRGLICEAYNPPFYPAFDFQPRKALDIAKQLNADSLRYPAASYWAYFPTRSGYPIHPELQGDPMRETFDLCRR